jgi:signal transduction histidine kinase
MAGATRELRRRTSDPQLLELADQVDRGIDHIQRLLERFQDLAGLTPTTPQPCNINQIIGECVEALRAGNATPSVTTELDPGAPVVMGDPVQLRMVFDELAQNALRHATRDGARFHIRTGITASTDGRKHVTVDVIDNGPGLSPMMKAQAFAPGVTTHAHGTGLGLAIVLQVVKSHRGTIEERGQAGSGAHFAITLPAEEKGVDARDQ